VSGPGRPRIRVVRTTKAPPAIGAYAHAVEAGGFLFVSGQGARDVATGREVGVECDADGRVLVDVGVGEKLPPKLADIYGIDHTEHSLERSLAAVGLGVEDVTDVVLTHLHFDHAGGLALIPKSVPVVAQRAEWEAAHDRAGVERNFFQPADYADAPPSLTLIDGDHDLLGDGSHLGIRIEYEVVKKVGEENTVEGDVKALFAGVQLRF
jgi:glyoxylase-like metal-dependent hydrolase (beta-lactamase superfamily II)